MTATISKAHNAIRAARQNGGSLFRRVAGCAEAVRLGWMESLTSHSKISTGDFGIGLTAKEKRNGWIDREWRLTDKAPK